jgi:HSP20 family protein
MEPGTQNEGRKSAMERQKDGGEQQRITRTSGNFSPQRWSAHPFDALTRLSRDMDQLMDSFFGGGFSSRFGGGGAGSGAATLWTPRIDMEQQGEELLISAELPGLSREQVQIEATEEGIAISGERREQREEGGRERDYHFSERSYGSFYRSIPLPEGAQVEQAKATMRDGVLEIRVPFKQRQQTRRIEISE